MGVQVLVTDPEELDKIRDRESDITKERIQKILGMKLDLKEGNGRLLYIHSTYQNFFIIIISQKYFIWHP